MQFKDIQQDTLAMTDTSNPHAALSRRQALQAAVGLGYAAAVLPTLAASAVNTTAQGLEARMATVKVNGFDVSFYAAQPAGKKNLPVVLVLSEIFGLHEYIADVARRFAHAGYLAIAPELFERQGDAQSYGEMAKLMAEVISKVPDAQVMQDLDAIVGWAEQNGGNTQRLGVTGFCWGGRQTWLYAAHQPKVKAAVAWYGRLVGNASPLTPKHPVDVVGQLHAPVLGLYGQADTGIPMDTVAKMQGLLAQGSAGAKASKFIAYAEAPHAFHADYRPSYREAAAKDGWMQCLDWFKTHGV